MKIYLGRNIDWITETVFMLSILSYAQEEGTGLSLHNFIMLLIIITIQLIRAVRRAERKVASIC